MDGCKQARGKWTTLPLWYWFLAVVGKAGVVAGNAHVRAVDKDGHGIATADAQAPKRRIHDGFMEGNCHWHLPLRMSDYLCFCLLARTSRPSCWEGGRRPGEALAHAGVVKPSVCMFLLVERPIDSRTETSSLGTGEPVRCSNSECSPVNDGLAPDDTVAGLGYLVSV